MGPCSCSTLDAFGVNGRIYLVWMELVYAVESWLFQMTVDLNWSYIIHTSMDQRCSASKDIWDLITVHDSITLEPFDPSWLLQWCNSCFLKWWDILAVLREDRAAIPLVSFCQKSPQQMMSFMRCLSGAAKEILSLNFEWGFCFFWHSQVNQRYICDGTFF